LFLPLLIIGSSPTHLKVDVKVVDVCGNWVTNTQYFEIKPVSALVNFRMIGPTDQWGSSSCPGNGSQSKYQSTSFTPIGIITAPAPPCVPGWLGASSAGVLSPGLGGTATATNTPMKVTIDEFDASMNYIQNISTSPYINLNVYPFNRNNPSNPANSFYFTTNYNTISNNNIYKVVVGIRTIECGDVKDSSYFKIINGGGSGSGNGSEYWRPGPGSQNGNVQLQTVNVFPNPATDKVHLSWRNETAAQSKGQISFTDVLGQIILQKELYQQEGNNDVLMDIAALAPGIYHYKLITAGGDFSGKLVKQ
jgi:hypothetical protein